MYACCANFIKKRGELNFEKILLLEKLEREREREIEKLRERSLCWNLNSRKKKKKEEEKKKQREESHLSRDSIN